MSDIGHNNPPLDPKEAIEKNIGEKSLSLIESLNFIKMFLYLAG